MENIVEELEKVCEELLDDADLDVELEKETGKIKLKFVTGNRKGELVEVLFECSEFRLFKMIKEPEDNESFLVKRTTVRVTKNIEEAKKLIFNQGWPAEKMQFPETLYHIEVYGIVEVNIICEKFSWHLQIQP